MSDQVNLFIDDKQVSVEPGTTLMAAAEALGDPVPVICYHPATTSNGLCRMCVVEIEGARTLAPACVTVATEGMRVHTHTERVLRSRRTILEMLSSSVDLSDSPEILGMLGEYHADPGRFPDAAPRTSPLLDDNPMFIRDYSKCVLCWRCVQVCAEDAQYTYAINFTGRGYETQIGTFFDKALPATTCVFCGQCIGVCPTGALKPKREWLIEQGVGREEVIQFTRVEGRKRRRPQRDQMEKQA